MILAYYIHLFNITFKKYIYNLSIINYSLNCFFNRKYLINLFYFLKTSTLLRFNLLNDIIVYDNTKRLYRFNIIYIITSTSYNNRMLCTTTTNELLPLISLGELFSGARWLEREIYDLFGILFTKHPDLRNLLTDYGLKGFPLRKDYPLTGFVELYYDEIDKKIKAKKVQMTQEYRHFNFQFNWK